MASTSMLGVRPPLRPIIFFAEAIGVAATVSFAAQMFQTTLSTVPILLTSPPSLLLHQFHLFYPNGRQHAWRIFDLSFTALETLTCLIWISTPSEARNTIGCNAIGKFLPAASTYAMTTLFTGLCMRKVVDELLGRAEALDRSTEQKAVVSEEELEEGWGNAEIRQVSNTSVRKMSWIEVFRIALGGNERRESLSVHQLVDVWGTLNLVAAGIAAFGAFGTLTAALVVRGTFVHARLPWTK